MDYTKIEQIQKLNAMLHNFEIKVLQKQSQTLIIETILPWAKLWQKEDFELKIHYSNCTFLDCEYYPIVNEKMIEAYPGKFIKNTVESHSDKVEEIGELQLNIINSSFNSPNTFTFWCESSLNIELAKLIFEANDIQFFDGDGNEISCEQMEVWKNKWWESIFN